MGKKDRQPRYTIYECQITEESFKRYREAPNPDDLVSVEGYYQLHPEKDDRPEHIKKQTEN